MPESLTARDELNTLTGTIVDAAYHIHSSLGPGLLESVYEILLEKELRKRGLHVQRQVPISFEYDGTLFKEGFCADLIIENRVIVEVKAVENLKFVFEQQLLTYLKLLNYRVGLLINFGDARIGNGIRRLVNKF